MNPAVELKNAGVTLHDRPVLSDVTLKIESGQFWGIAGPNGAGKSTLVRLLPGFTRLSSGKLRILGREVSDWPVTELRRRVGYLPQHLFFDEGVPISAREVVLIGRTGMRGLFRPLGPDDRRIAQESAAELGVDHLLDRPFGALSGGERQRILLARALAQEPELLVLDEPTAGLDPRAAGHFLDTVNRLQSAHRFTVIVVTHEIAFLPAGCGHVALLRDGRILAAGDKEVMLAPETLSELYGCRVEVHRHAGRYHIFQD